MAATSAMQSVNVTVPSVQLYASYSGLYTIPVQIGTPAQGPLDLVLDTGSTAFWVWSSLLPADYITYHSYYDFDVLSSQTAQVTNQTFSARDAYGPVYKDNVTVGQLAEFSGNYSIGLAESVGDTWFYSNDTDGSFGFGLPINDTEYPTPHQTWLMSTKFQENIFALSLSANSTSSIDFGYNESRHTSEVAWTPVNTPAINATPSWSFTWDGFSIGTKPSNITSKVRIDVDTSINYVNLPDSIAASYYDSVPGSTFDNDSAVYVYPCNITNSLPSFSFIVNGSSLVVAGGVQMQFGYPLPDNVTCYGAIQKSGDENEGIFGTPFLEGIYTVFDYGAKRLGFAPATSPNY